MHLQKKVRTRLLLVTWGGKREGREMQWPKGSGLDKEDCEAGRADGRGKVGGSVEEVRWVLGICDFGDGGISCDDKDRL